MRTRARRLSGRSGEPTAAAEGSQSAVTTEAGGPAGHDAGKKIKGRKRHLTVDVEGSPITIDVHPADIQDRDGAPAVMLGMLEKAPEVTKLWLFGAETGREAGGAWAWRGTGGLSDFELSLASSQA